MTDLGTFIQVQYSLNLVLYMSDHLNLTQRGLLTRPDCFIHPRLWSTYGNLLRTILVDKPEASATAISLRPQHAQEICAALKVEYEKISMRIDALLFRTLPPREARSLRSTLASIKVLCPKALLIGRGRRKPNARLLPSYLTPSVRRPISPTSTSLPPANPSPLTPSERNFTLF